MSASGITLDPDSIAFGSIDVGLFSSASLNIKSAGFGPYSITSVSNSDPQFASNIMTGTLGTGDNLFNVSFAPASVGSFSDTFVIMVFNGSDDSTTEFDLPVTGDGMSPPPPAAGSFVSVTSN